MEGTIGEIRLFAASFAPRNWAYCNGSLIAIRVNTALFSILGTTYGGDGVTTFSLPNLNGRLALGVGQGPGLSSQILGETAGSPNTTLTIQNLAPHTHPTSINVAVPAYSEAGNSSSGNNATLSSKAGIYSADADSKLKAVNTTVVVQPQGGNQPFSIVQPVLGMNYIICMYGIFPSRN